METFISVEQGLSAYLLIFLFTLLTVRVLQSVLINIFNPIPGPWGFPVLGHLPLLGKNPAQTLFDMSKTYGDVFQIRMGSWPTVILNKKDVIREALMDKDDIFSDRPEFFTAKCLNNMRGLAFGSYTPRWKLHRKIANNVLRHFVNGKDNNKEDIIYSEVTIAVDNFLKAKGIPICPHDDIFLAVGSIIFQICFGSSKNSRTDKDFLQFISNTRTFVETSGAGSPIDVLPWLQYVMPWKAKQFMDVVNQNITLVSNQVEDHKASFNNNDRRDVCDGLIASAEEYGNTPVKNEGITKHDILSTLQDFMGAGFETVSTTMEWLILYLAHHQDVQKKVQREIDTVIGTRKATFKDKRNLPFTEAMILEVTRIANVVPMGLPHATTSDTVFHNYPIRKGTVVFCNFYATARDENMWESPNDFIPERFLDEKGEINMEKADNVPTFGMGRRRCPGEPLAKTELFLFTVNIFQRCDLNLVSEPNFEPTFGLTCKPKPYEIVVLER